MFGGENIILVFWIFSAGRSIASRPSDHNPTDQILNGYFFSVKFYSSDQN
jgi:hypothetical protein